MLFSAGSDALNFETVPQRLAYQRFDDSGFVTVNVILSRQRDIHLLMAAVDLQNRVRRFASQMGVPTAHTPDERGLYYYPANRLHCSLVNDSEKRTIDQVKSIDRAVHPWLQGADENNCDLLPFPAEARWFYGAQDPTTSFSLQLFIPREIASALEARFEETLHYCESKMYPTGNASFRRGVINLARLTCPRNCKDERLPAPSSMIRLFSEFDSEFRAGGSSAGYIDKLFVVKSNSWLSNDDPIVRTIRGRLPEDFNGD